MGGMDSKVQMVHYYPCCKKPIKWTEGFILYLLQMATLQSFILLKKKKNHRPKWKGLCLQGHHTWLCSGNDS